MYNFAYYIICAIEIKSYFHYILHLTDYIKMATKVLNNKTDCDTKEVVRRTFYKNRIRKDNIKLELDEDWHQEERRNLLLKHQKEYV